MPDLLTQFDPRMLVIAGGVFGLFLSVWLLVMLAAWRKRKEHEDVMRERLAVITDEDDAPRVLRLWRDGLETTTVVAGQSAMKRWRKKLEGLPEAAGWQVPVRSLLMGIVGAMCLVMAIAYPLCGSVLVAIAAGGLVPIVFSIYVNWRVDKEKVRFEAQFVDAMDLIARSLRAGHPLAGAFRLAAEELKPPVASLFAELCQQQSMGVSIEESLKRTARGARGEEVKLFATSVAIQMRTGGNLAEMIERLAEVIRDRIRLNRRVRVVTAQVQLSKRILLGLPVFMFVVLNIANPRHMEGLYETELGHKLLAIGIGAMLLGWYTMNQMVKIKY